tara:strand:- start:45 stop:653 length:609 start_codon:yes stop_codon:yes gene_type:complete
MAQSIEELYRFGLKLFVEPDCTLNSADCIPIFHRWIQTQALDLLLIDVADYTHLSSGPSVLLVAHEGNLAIDTAEGRAGLLCTSKQPQTGSFAERLASVAKNLIKAARLLEDDITFEGRLRFTSTEFQFHANDRLLAPPGTESVSSLTPALQKLMSIGYPGEAHQIEINPHSQNRLRIQLTTSQSISLDSLFERFDQNSRKP